MVDLRGAVTRRDASRCILWESVDYDVITIGVDIRQLKSEGRLTTNRLSGDGIQIPIPHIHLYKCRNRVGFIRTTQPPRPEIDFSFVKIRFLDCVCVVLMKVYQSKIAQAQVTSPFRPLRDLFRVK